MNSDEKRRNETEFAAKCCDTSCSSDSGGFKMPECCQSEGQTDGCHSMMSKCKWFPLIPVVFGVVLLLLGYYLDAEITRVLWMVVAGLTVLLGTFGLVMMGRIKGACCG